jgi:hypothetical protein
MARLDPAASGSASAEPSIARILVAGILVVIAIPAITFGSLVASFTLEQLEPGPRLGINPPHHGQVLAHLDTFGRFPPNLAGLRITEAATHAVIWDVKPVSGKSECWNGCWILTLKAGENPASFRAGHQQFLSQIPSSQTFALLSGVRYVLEVRDSKGRVNRRAFKL